MSTLPPIKCCGFLIERPTKADWYSVRFEVAQTVVAVILLIASFGNASWDVIAPLCSIIIVVGFLISFADLYKMAKVREIRKWPLVLLGIDSIVLMISAGILYLWSEVQYGVVDQQVSGVAYALDIILLLASMGTVAGRLLLRARDRRQSEVETEISQTLHQAFEEGGNVGLHNTNNNSSNNDTGGLISMGSISGGGGSSGGGNGGGQIV
jgi:uncharacterized membrane protein YgcG